MDKTKTKDYVVGILIAGGFYFVCTIVNSIVHVLIAFAGGYSSYSELINDASVALSLAIVVSGTILHIIAAWLTVVFMEKYGMKQDCISYWYFVSAAISIVVIALVIIPVLFSSTPGWLLYTSHALSLLYFGKRVIGEFDSNQILPESSNNKEATKFTSVIGIPVKPITETSEEQITEEIKKQVTENDSEPVTHIEPQLPSDEDRKAFYCHNCGAKLTTGIKYCYHCGTKVEDFSKL